MRLLRQHDEHGDGQADGDQPADDRQRSKRRMALLGCFGPLHLALLIKQLVLQDTFDEGGVAIAATACGEVTTTEEETVFTTGVRCVGRRITTKGFPQNHSQPWLQFVTNLTRQRIEFAIPPLLGKPFLAAKQVIHPIFKSIAKPIAMAVELVGRWTTAKIETTTEAAREQSALQPTNQFSKPFVIRHSNQHRGHWNPQLQRLFNRRNIVAC